MFDYTSKIVDVVRIPTSGNRAMYGRVRSDLHVLRMVVFLKVEGTSEDAANYAWV